MKFSNQWPIWAALSLRTESTPHSGIKRWDKRKTGLERPIDLIYLHNSHFRPANGHQLVVETDSRVDS
jgi:hypothetical protein